VGWIRLDFGLLDDSGFGAMSAAARGAWITAYLLQKRREGALFQDVVELQRLLRKEGIDEADTLNILPMMEYPDPDRPALGIKGYEVYQKDPTSAERQKRYRDRLRASRNATGTSHDGTYTEDREKNRQSALRNDEGPTSMAESMAKAGGFVADLVKKAQRGVNDEDEPVV